MITDMTTFDLRPIESGDDETVGQIIRQVMSEFTCVGPEYSIEDPELNAMSQAYADDRNRFFVLTRAGVVVGCGGFGQLAGEDESICELRKMYLLPAARGFGMGKRLLDHCLAAAQAAGYRKMYLETVVRMEAANGLYRQYGFEELPAPLGATGHTGCDAFFIREL
jgi:putative acetyltransferase